MRRLAFLAVLALAAIGSGCVEGALDGINGRGAATPQIRSRASSDLDCPDTEIRVIEEFGGRYKAVGCGRKAYYQAACDGLRCAVESGDGPMIPSRDRPDPEGAVPPR